MPYYTNDECAYLIQNYSNLGARICGEYLNRSRETVTAKARSMGLKISAEDFSKRQMRCKNPETLNVNPNHFKEVKNEYIAYMLGFLWGDGNINTKTNYTSIHICESDALLLDPIFQKTGKWNKTFTLNNKPNQQNSYHFRTRNKALRVFLQDLGYCEKTYISHEKIIEYIPSKYQYVWFRGFIDADGSFAQGQSQSKSFSITSSYEQDWNYLISYFNKMDINLYLRRQCKVGNNNSRIYTETFETIEKIGNFIYPNLWDGIGFERKFQKWKTIMLASKRYKIKTIFPKNLV